MTGRRLYEKYTDALAECKRSRWDGNSAEYVLTYPRAAPLAWGFLSDNQRKTWNVLARKVTPRKPKLAPQTKTVHIVLTSVGEKKIQAIKGVRAVFGFDLREAKDIVDGLAVGVPWKVQVSEDQWTDAIGITLTEHDLRYVVT